MVVLLMVNYSSRDLLVTLLMRCTKLWVGNLLFLWKNCRSIEECNIYDVWVSIPNFNTSAPIHSNSLIVVVIPLYSYFMLVRRMWNNGLFLGIPWDECTININKKPYVAFLIDNIFCTIYIAIIWNFKIAYLWKKNSFLYILERYFSILLIASLCSYLNHATLFTVNKISRIKLT